MAVYGKSFRVYSRSSFYILSFIGRQEMTEMKRSGIEVTSWIRSNPECLRSQITYRIPSGNKGYGIFSIIILCVLGIYIRICEKILILFKSLYFCDISIFYFPINDCKFERYKQNICLYKTLAIVQINEYNSVYI